MSKPACVQAEVHDPEFRGPPDAIAQDMDSRNSLVCFVALACVAVPGASALRAQPISLLPPVSFLPPASAFTGGAGAGSSICGNCLASADFNGDGNQDIVYSGSVDTPYAGVLLGNGDGTFRTAFTFSYQRLSVPAPLAVGDFNGDGKADVVFLGSTPSVYLGNGDGTFSGPFTVAGLTNALYWPDGTPNRVATLAVTDFNKDGKQDLVCGPTVLLSNGDGTFVAAASPLDGDVLLTGDFNGDGIPDILLASEGGRFAVVLGRGDGTFRPDLPLSVALSLVQLNAEIYGQSILAGDFNGDGRLDIAGTSPDGTRILVLPGNGDGTFGSAVSTPGAGARLVATGDFNRDGKLDIVAGDALLAGNGDGTFRFPVFTGVVTQDCNNSGLASEGGFLCTHSHNATAVADFNNDGLPDLASGYVIQNALNPYSQASISIMLNDSPGDGFTATGILSAGFTWPAAADSLVSAFGVNLAPSTEAAATTPLPTTLGGIRLHVRYRSTTADILAPLLYVSPTQINYLLPAPPLSPVMYAASTTEAFAWVGIERTGSAYVPKGMSVPLATIAPGLFSVGANLAAASALSITSNAAVAIPVVSCSGAACTAIPIDLSGPPIYLSLYGTGFDRATVAGSSCTIAGKVLPATYVGPQEEFAGLDQLNLLLPASLAGTGITSLACTTGLLTQASMQSGGVTPVTTNAVILSIR